jgi:hypothetical protein
MKEIKEKIINQKNKMNTLLENIHSGDIKKIKKSPIPYVNSHVPG